MTYDHWKTTNPDDRYLGSAPQNGDNPHNFTVQERGTARRRFWIIVNENYEWVAPFRAYPTQDAADDAIGEMIADDDADRRLHRNRHEGSEP